MNCPWCDAKPNKGPYANLDEWECGSFMRGKRRYQTDGCRVRQADKQIDELSRQRDEAVKAAKLSLDWLDEVCNPDNEDLRSREGMVARAFIEGIIARVEGEQK